jgi:hypothetical protein
VGVLNSTLLKQTPSFILQDAIIISAAQKLKPEFSIKMTTFILFTNFS